MTSPDALRPSISFSTASASWVNLVLRISTSGLAIIRVASDAATPMVFSPRSSPSHGVPGGVEAASSSRVMTVTACR